MPILQMRLTKSKEASSSSYFLTIPKEIIEIMGWKKGNRLIITPLDDNSIKVEKR